MAAPDPSDGAMAALQSIPLVPHLRGWWDALLLFLVVVMDLIKAELPTIIQIIAIAVGLLTAAQKLIELGWVKNPRRKDKD